MLDQAGEKLLVSHILEGKRGSAKQLYRNYFQAVKMYVMNRTRCEEDAEEIVQDVFLAAIESMGIFGQRSRLISWLYGIARHEISDYYRKKRVRTVLTSKVPFLFEMLGDENWEEKYDKITVNEQIKVVLDRLFPRYAKALKMKYLEGWSVKDMALELGETFKATETVLFRARKAFVLEWNNLYEG